MRLPDRLFRVLDRIVRNERRRRSIENQRQAERDDLALRAWADRMREAHRIGTCGGRAAGCMFVPCIPPVD